MFDPTQSLGAHFRWQKLRAHQLRRLVALLERLLDAGETGQAGRVYRRLTWLALEGLQATAYANGRSQCHDQPAALKPSVN